MTDTICYDCYHFGEVEKNGIICNRIMPCYVALDKKECKYFKQNNNGDKNYE